MHSKRNQRRILVLTTCMSLAVISIGCRSGKTGNMFSFRSEPSPEALAGDGPTTTYPAPPSASASPEAIASVAGGTGASSTTPITSASTRQSATAQVAGFDLTPGYVAPATPNMAAAQANGFHGGAKAAGFQAPSSDPPAITPGIMTPNVTAPKTTTSGYQFGTNPEATTAAASSYNIPSSYIAPVSQAPATNDTKSHGGGFTLPKNLTGALVPKQESDDACASCAGCDNCKSAPASTSLTPSATLGSQEYSPGSLSNAGDYPTGSN